MTSWLQNLDTLLEDGKTRTRGWNAAKWWRNANSWLQDLETLLERTRNAARGRRNANSCSQDRQALLEDLVVAEWQLPDSTLRACWNITRDHRARLVWSNLAIFCGSEISRKLLFSRFNNQVTVTMVTRLVRRQLGAHGFDSFHSSLALLPDSQIFIFSVLLRTLSNSDAAAAP